VDHTPRQHRIKVAGWEKRRVRAILTDCEFRQSAVGIYNSSGIEIAMRILFVSNRLPIVLEQQGNDWSIHGASGGLVTALDPVLKRWGGVWIGWPGNADIEPAKLDELIADFGQREGYQIVPVPISHEDHKKFYDGYCNQIIWPLFHDLQTLSNFQPDFWASSQKVEKNFAQIVQQNARPGDLIWVQDYQLMGLGKALAEIGVDNKLAFFLHIPFPSPDIFCKLPWRKEVIEGLLHYEVIGLQTTRDLRNFSDCVNRLLPHVEQRHTSRQSRLKLNGHTCVAGVFPIGIDFEEFARGANEPEVMQMSREFRDNYPDRQIILGVDRLDYTKGIPYRLRSMARALERYPDLHRKVTLFQVVVPSREGVPQYQDLKLEIEQMVTHINGKFTEPGWVPIHYVFRHVERKELLAWYRAADVALVTPLKDGMNLVAKEYCAAKVDGNGVLVLSEFAGASEQLGRWAVLVNPYDVDCVADAIKLAAVMTLAERREAMEKLRTNVREQDVHWWLSQFLKACRTNLREPAHLQVTGNVA
jgi:trehalose 6-phosphate synthase/phosphatase